MTGNIFRVVIVDDHPIIRAGVRTVLGTETDIELVGEGSCAADALRLTLALNPDVLILDLNLPDLNGLEVTRRLRSKGSGAGFVPAKGHSLEQNDHFGLAGMQERVKLISGEWNLSSAPGEGTTIRVNWDKRAWLEALDNHSAQILSD